MIFKLLYCEGKPDWMYHRAYEITYLLNRCLAKSMIWCAASNCKADVIA